MLCMCSKQSNRPTLTFIFLMITREQRKQQLFSANLMITRKWITRKTQKTFPISQTELSEKVPHVGGVGHWRDDAVGEGCGLEVAVRDLAARVLGVLDQHAVTGQVGHTRAPSGTRVRGQQGKDRWGKEENKHTIKQTNKWTKKQRNKGLTKQQTSQPTI